MVVSAHYKSLLLLLLIFSLVTSTLYFGNIMVAMNYLINEIMRINYVIIKGLSLPICR